MQEEERSYDASLKDISKNWIRGREGCIVSHSKGFVREVGFENEVDSMGLD